MSSVINMESRQRPVALPARYGSDECDQDDVLDASNGDAHCRWCGSIMPATGYTCAVSGRCCSAVCQALYGGIEIPFAENGEINGGELRRLIKQYGPSSVTVKERLLPEYVVQENKKMLERSARDHVSSLKARAKELGVRWAKDWKAAGWKTEKQFLTEMAARIAKTDAQTAPVGESRLSEAA
jgi:hypothetical protein